MSADESGIQRLAHLIKTTRESLGWTQPDLAEAARVSRPTVQRYENAKSRWPEPDSVRKIFRALGMDPREIPVILGLVTRAELDLPPVIEPAVRRFSAETERIITALEDPTVSTAEKVALYQLLIARIAPRATSDGNRGQVG